MKTKYLSINELALLRAHLTAAEWLPFAVTLETGLRIGDVLKIRVEDLHENKIAYKAEKTGKSGEAEISVDLMLQLHQNADKHGWVFPGRVPGEHLTRQAAFARLKRACKRAGIDASGIAPHSFRKTFAVETFRTEGAREAQKALQHNDISTTELYIFADWLTGNNAFRPLLRLDLEKIVSRVVEIVKVMLDNSDEL